MIGTIFFFTSNLIRRMMGLLLLFFSQVSLLGLFFSQVSLLGGMIGTIFFTSMFDVTIMG